MCQVRVCWWRRPFRLRRKRRSLCEWILRVLMVPPRYRRRRNRRRKERTHLATRRPHSMDPNHTLEQKSSNLNYVFAALSVRHFARQQGVDPGLVPGSGKNGWIEKGDIESFLNNQYVASTLGVLTSEPLGDDVVELGRTRYGMWKRW